MPPRARSEPVLELIELERQGTLEPGEFLRRTRELTSSPSGLRDSKALLRPQEPAPPTWEPTAFEGRHYARSRFRLLGLPPKRKTQGWGRYEPGWHCAHGVEPMGRMDTVLLDIHKLAKTSPLGPDTVRTTRPAMRIGVAWAPRESSAGTTPGPNGDYNVGKFCYVKQKAPLWGAASATRLPRVCDRY